MDATWRLHPRESSLDNQSTTVAVQAVPRFTVSLSRSEQGGNELSAVLFALELVDFPVTGEGEEDGCVPRGADAGEGGAEVVQRSEEVVSEDPQVGEGDVRHNVCLIIIIMIKLKVFIIIAKMYKY